MDKKLEVSANTTIIRLIEERLKSESSLDYEKFIKLNDKGKLEYIKQNFDHLNVGYDEALFEEINHILYPLLEKVVNEEVNKEMVENYFPKSNRSTHNLFEFRMIMEKYSNYVSLASFEEKSRLSLSYYLLIVESVFSIQIDLIIYLLIKNNVKYYIMKNTKKQFKNISTLKEIGTQNLSDKLKFLEDNGLSIISNCCDRELRNSVAHMEIIVFKDGSVAYNNKPNNPIISKEDLENKIERSLNVIHCIIESMQRFYNDKYGRK